MGRPPPLFGKNSHNFRLFLFCRASLYRSLNQTEPELLRRCSNEENQLSPPSAVGRQLPSLCQSKSTIRFRLVVSAVTKCLLYSLTGGLCSDPQGLYPHENDCQRYIHTIFFNINHIWCLKCKRTTTLFMRHHIFLPGTTSVRMECPSSAFAKMVFCGARTFLPVTGPPM